MPLAGIRIRSVKRITAKAMFQCANSLNSVLNFMLLAEEFPQSQVHKWCLSYLWIPVSNLHRNTITFRPMLVSSNAKD